MQFFFIHQWLTNIDGWYADYARCDKGDQDANKDIFKSYAFPYIIHVE